MAQESDDVLKANQGAPAADIPDLKKKDKERKKAGAAWNGAKGAAGEFTGATGGTVSRAAASAASAAAEGALAGAEAIEGGGFFAELFGGISRFFAGLMSTALGKLAVAAAAFLLMAAAGLLGYALMKGGDAGLGVPNLGGISDSMRIRNGGSDRLGVASNGELRFDPLNPNAPKEAPKAEEKKPEETPADKLKDTTAEDAAKGLAGQDKLAHNLAGAKLSSSLGGDFGGKNIFAGNSGAPKFDNALGKVSMPKFGAQKGQLSSMASKKSQATATSRSIGKAKTSRAIGQLKMAKGMSMLGAQANSAEGAASAAQGAFDQQQTQGGGLNTVGGPGTGGTVNPTGNGAPDTSMPTTPTTPTGTAVDPGLQNALNSIGQMADTARQMQQTGTELLLIGAVLIAAGIALLAFGFTAWIGAMLIGLGGMLVGMGFMMMQMAQMMAQMAKSMGSALSSQIGNQQQGKVINYCTDQALAGTPTSSCNPPDSVTNSNAQDAQNTSDVNRVKAIPKDTPTIQQ